MRTVVKAIPGDAKNGLRYGAVPWRRFAHAFGPGEEIPGFLAVLASQDAEAAERALRDLWNCLCHQGGTSAVGALAVPFLLRIAATGFPGLRAETFRLVAEIGRCQHLGDGTREGFLQVSEDPSMVEGETGCPVGWTVQAARDAVACDLDLLLPFLHDPSPETRSAAGYVLAVSTGEAPRISSALHERLGVEDDPVVRMSLVLAIAQLAREHHDGRAPVWARGLWSDPGRPPGIRIGAALAWLCLVDDPVPDDLRAFLTDPDTGEQSDLFQQVPWFPPVDGQDGLRRCIHDMLTPEILRERTK